MPRQKAMRRRLHSKLQLAFANDKFEITGEFRRQMEVIDKLEWVTSF